MVDGTTRGGAGHLGLTHAETQRGTLWTACGQRRVDSNNSQTTPATTNTTTIRHLLGATDSQMAHHATSSTAPAHQPLGSSKSTGRSSRQNAATRRNMRRGERVTVQGPVKKQQPDGMSHRGYYDHRVSVLRIYTAALYCGSVPLLFSTTQHRDSVLRLYTATLYCDSKPRLGTATLRYVLCAFSQVEKIVTVEVPKVEEVEVVREVEKEVVRERVVVDPTPALHLKWANADIATLRSELDVVEAELAEVHAQLLQNGLGSRSGRTSVTSLQPPASVRSSRSTALRQSPVPSAGAP